MARGAEKLRCTKEPYIEDIGPRKIKSILFDAFSGEEIKKIAEVQVWNNELYDATAVKPVAHGLIDSRMGPANKKTVCGTCHGGFTDCPGHFGYLKLTLPVFNVGYFNSILNILKCICKACCRILLPEKERKFFLVKTRNPRADVHQRNNIMKNVRNKCKSFSRCPRCGHNNGNVSKAKSQLAVAESFRTTVDESLEECRAALSHLKEKVSFQPVHLLTPSKVLALFKKMPNEECWNLLQGFVVEYINSEAPSVPESKHRGLVERLKGKQGRFHCNLSGKHVEFTGRTVISPDPNLKITEVAIPILMAQVLTYPERVTHHNIEKLRQCVRNGPFKHPGANFVILPDGTRLHLKYVEKKNVANELKYGCVVERHLEDGDIVLFNRQPSLHRMSIISHREDNALENPEVQ